MAIDLLIHIQLIHRSKLRRNNKYSTYTRTSIYVYAYVNIYVYVCTFTCAYTYTNLYTHAYT